MLANKSSEAQEQARKDSPPGVRRYMALLISRFHTCSFQNCETIVFDVLSLAVYDTLLWQPITRKLIHIVSALPTSIFFMQIPSHNHKMTRIVPGTISSPFLQKRKEGCFFLVYFIFRGEKRRRRRKKIISLPSRKT